MSILCTSIAVIYGIIKLKRKRKNVERINLDTKEDEVLFNFTIGENSQWYKKRFECTSAIKIVTSIILVVTYFLDRVVYQDLDEITIEINILLIIVFRLLDIV